MTRTLERLAAVIASPRGRWLAVLVWVPLGLAGLFAHAHLGDVTAAGQSSYLPSNSESTRVVEALQRNYRGGNDVPVLIVFDREGGLTNADLNSIGKLGRGLEGLGLVGATPVFAPYSEGTGGPLGRVARIAHGIGPISRDGEAALVGLAIDADDRGAIARGVHKIRVYLAAHRVAGLHSYVTGPGGIAADLERVADDAGRTLLLATLSLVLVLLLLVYRAPILALLPLLVVGAAYLVATGIVYLLIDAGLITVNTEGTMLLLVLIFGAGTDYSLLLVHRYREELGAGREPGEALPTALRESAPAIAASAGTVIAAMLVLLVAELESTRWLGPILAIGVATMLVASFTLLPALLALLGERAFWPAAPAGNATDALGGASRGRGLGPISTQTSTAAGYRWRRVADLVRRRPRTIVATVLAVLALLALGNLAGHDTIGFGQGEIGATESATGTKVLDEHFPPGLGSPLTAVVDVEQVPPALRGLKDLSTVKLTLPVPPSPGSDEAVLTIVLRGNPYSGDAAAAVEEIRDKLDEVAPSALVGGIPAENYDVEQANTRDTRLIVPLVLLVVGMILILVLRALVAPAYLIATVVASFAATLGLATFVFAATGIAFNLVLMSFIFLVALGVDYNIFLMTRAREEAAVRGTREGVLVALENTGGVVTGAGVILAGTFATLTLLPLEQLVQIGATVAIGVLLDTFVVRALLIPAITYLLGERTWWPSRA